MATLELAERNDVHKSCKSLETLLNVFNDYCEAAGAIAMIEKKLVKALKDVANLKITGQNAANAFSASASIFEASMDVDSKYAKIVDKEYDSISNEVKKWFKKLAKEEKAHDERLVNANARIKQASQSLEKKTKRNARDTGDEHTRYMNLISSIGPEISQDRYSHSLMITQKQSITTHSVAACISRVADAEWHRACESVKNYAPNVGSVGQYRALCEGGWTASPPADLPDNEPPKQRLQVAFDPQTIAERTSPTTRSPARHSRELPLPSPVTETPSRRQSFDDQQRPPPPPSSYSFEPPRALADPNGGSVRSLSEFPAPPTHFPVPAPSTSLNRPGSRGPLPNPTSPPMSPAMRNSMSILQDPVARPALAARRSTQDIRTVLSVVNADTTEAYGGVVAAPAPEQPNTPKESPQDVPRRASPTSTSNSDSVSSATRTHGRGDYMGDEQGNKRRSIDQRPQGLVRSDTTDSSGSLVAAIRSKYVQNSGATSPPPKDIPRLPLSVSDLATRYQVSDESPISPRSRPASPFMPRPLPTIDTRRQGDNNGVFKEPSSPTKTHRHHASLPVNNLRSELPYLSETEARVKDKERELRAREREIEQRTQELDMQLNKMNARGGYVSGPTQSPGPSRPAYPKRASSQVELAMQMNGSRTITHSSSTTSLVPPPSPVRQRRLSQETSPRSSTDHSPSCGCETCSVSKYRSSSPSGPVMYIRPNPNEKKGWMRRLSMPSVNPKKNSSHKGLMSLDGKMNFSTTMLRGGIPEDDKVSYEASRSVTSLGGFRR